MNHDAHEAYDGERKTDGEELGKASQRQTDGVARDAKSVALLRRDTCSQQNLNGRTCSRDVVAAYTDVMSAARLLIECTT